MTSTKISDLPVDLLMEIGSRVPLKSMRTVRLTCKSWDTLSKTGIFRKMHKCNEAAREAGESRMVLIMDFNLYLISVFVADVDHPSTELKGKLNRLSLDDDSDEEVKIIKVFHCEGLKTVLSSWFGIRIWAKQGGSNHLVILIGIDRYRYALGYDHTKKSHKILRFTDDNRFSDEPEPRSLGTPHWFIPFYETGVPLNGNTYWLATHRNSDYDGTDRFVCFDFTSEKFGPVLPLPFP